MTRRNIRLRAFTLAEIIVAGAIMSMVIIATGALLHGLLIAYDAAYSYTDLVVSGRFATQSIVSDASRADSVSVSGGELTIGYRENYDDGAAEHYYFSDSAFPALDDTTMTTVTYALSGDSLVETRTVEGASSVVSTLCSGVASFTPTYSPQDAQSRSRLDVELTLTDNEGKDWTFNRLVYPVNLELLGGRRLQ